MSHCEKGPRTAVVMFLQPSIALDDEMLRFWKILTPAHFSPEAYEVMMLHVLSSTIILASCKCKTCNWTVFTCFCSPH